MTGSENIADDFNLFVFNFTEQIAKPLKKKKFNELLQKVVFVLSGFQNPARGEIRDKGLLMGAQYRRDWDADCTHLV